MGISRGTVRLIGMTLGAVAQRGMAITFGVQKLQCGHAEALSLLARAGVAPVVPAAPADGAMRQETLFGLLGFGRVDSIDFYPDEKPTHTLDLTQEVPAHMQSQYALVYDGGTMEHCFDPARVLANAVALARPGGTVIHHVPLNNWVNHGFYQFSPTLFFDFYDACGFEDMRMMIHFMHGGRESCLRYDPKLDTALPYALGGRRRCLVFFSARKPEPANLRWPARPIQGRYRATFGGEPTARRDNEKTLAGRLRRSLRKRCFAWGAQRLV